MKQVDISTLKHWEENPRDITEDAFIQLLEQLRYGEVENLIVMKDGTILNGNRRLDAYQMVGKNTAWVSEVDFLEQPDGTFEMTVDGNIAVHLYPEDKKGTPVVFKTIRQGMSELMLLGNSHVGTFNDMDLAELLSDVTVEPNLFEINLKKGTKVEDLVKAFSPGREPTYTDPALPKDFSDTALNIPCTSDEYEFIMSAIKRAKKIGGYNSDGEVLFEAMVIMDEHMEEVSDQK
jgi:hypothetical protein